MPIESQNTDAPKAKTGDDSWARTCSILLDDTRLKGTTVERLRQYHEAEEAMGKEVKAFSNDGFELVDTDKNGYLSAKETKAAIAKAPEGLNKDVLKYIDKNMSTTQKYSDDETLWEWSGASRKDLERAPNALHSKFDGQLADELLSSMRREDMKGLEEIVHEMKDKPECLSYIMSRARGHNADITQLRYASGTETIDGKKVGYADITANYAHRLTIYTDPAVPTEGRNWKSETWRGWFGKGHWEKANPRNVLDDIGYEARNY